MGFKYDPSTAGSSVRFDPPNPKDKVSFANSQVIGLITRNISQSITFHKRALFSVLLLIPPVHVDINSQHTLIRRCMHTM